MIREQVAVEDPCHGEWDHPEFLVWRVMEVADGMILRVRVCEGGSICDLFYFFMMHEVWIYLLHNCMTWLHNSKTSL